MAERENHQIPIRRHRVPHLETYEVTTDELEQIERESTQVGQDFAFASNSLTAAIAFLVALLTASVESTRIFVVFVIITIIGFLSALYFGVRWYKGRRAAKSVVQRIREREVGPLGEEGKEIKPTQLAELPAQEAGTGERK